MAARPQCCWQIVVGVLGDHGKDRESGRCKDFVLRVTYLPKQGTICAFDGLGAMGKVLNSLRQV